MVSAPASDNVFVGDLPAALGQDALSVIFSAYGEVVQCRMLPPKGQNGKASALVRFSSVDEATWVIENLNGNIAEGLEAPIVCKFANAPGQSGAQAWGDKGGAQGAANGTGKGTWAAPQWPSAGKGGGVSAAAAPPSDNVFIGDLPAHLTQDDLQSMFSQFGTIQQCRTLPPKGTQTKCCALVRFGSVEEATYVVESLNGAMIEGLEAPISVRFANAPGGDKGGGKGAGKEQYRSEPYSNGVSKGGGWTVAPWAAKGAKGGGKGGATGSFYALYGAIKKGGLLGNLQVPQECMVYVRNLPADTTDGDLYKLFAPFGAVPGVKAMTTPEGACNGTGFVDFSDPSFAQSAVDSLNGFTMPDGTSIQVSLKQPGKGKAGGKGNGKANGGAEPTM